MDENKGNKCCGGGPCNAPAPQAEDVPRHADLKDAIAEALAASGQQVFDMVKEHKVNEELALRRDDILKGFTKLEELNKQLKGFKPDQESFDADGKVVTATFSKAQADAMKKVKEQIARLEKGLETALNVQKPCFKGLRDSLK